MNNTPETDHIEDQLGSAAKFSHPVLWRHARDLERERDETREQNDKLRDIAEMAIEYVGHTSVQKKLRSELDQLKEGAK